MRTTLPRPKPATGAIRREANRKIAAYLRRNGRQPSTIYIVGHLTLEALYQEMRHTLSYVRLNPSGTVSEEIAANYLIVKRVVFRPKGLLAEDLDNRDAVEVGARD